MGLEYRLPLTSNEGWRPIDFSINRIARMAAYQDVQVRDAETKERIALKDLPGIRTNGGQICDVSSGPCSCGAFH